MKKTGVPRTTIYFYIAQGLLPQPDKMASGRSLYTEEHVNLLEKIRGLKEQGHSLADIAAELQDELDQAGNRPDVASQEHERIHAEILRVSTQEFAEKGYRRTHVATIIKRLGINPYVFYSHFPNKLQLLLECFNNFLRWDVADKQAQIVSSQDLGERVLRRVTASERLGELGTDLLAAIRIEGLSNQLDPYRLSDVWDSLLKHVVEDLNSVRPPASPSPPIPFELICYSLIGGFRNVKARVAWDDKYTDADRLRTHLFIFLAIICAIRGDVDVYSMLARYENLIEELVTHKPGLPPQLED